MKERETENEIERHRMKEGILQKIIILVGLLTSAAEKPALQTPGMGPMGVKI